MTNETDVLTGEITSTDESRYKVLSNGAVYDLQTKKIVKGAALDSDKARALVKKRVEARRAVVQDVANSHASAGRFTAAGSFAWLAAIVDSAMSKATNPSDPKAIEAARFVAEYAGESESMAESGSAADDLRGLVRDIAEMARAVESAASIVQGSREDV